MIENGFRGGQVSAGKENEYFAVKFPIAQKLRAYRRQMAADFGHDMTFSDVVAELLSSYAEAHPEIRVVP